MKLNIPKPSISRICMVYHLLGELQEAGEIYASSTQIGETLGIGAHSIRKDISYLGDFGNTGARYNIAKLREHINNKLNMNKPRKACIVGLGRLGSAILNFKQFSKRGYNIVAGFDSNVNKLETLKTPIKLYPAYRISEIIRLEQIELAVLAVPSEAAQVSADRLLDGGIKGIVNFTPTIIKTERKDVFISNIDVVKEFRILSAMIDLSHHE
jgi:redox-sensing transcriptional repressor